MESTGLFLRVDQVVQGMTLALCLEGMGILEDSEGDPLVVRALVGGVSQLEVRLYPLKGGLQFYSHKNGRGVIANGYSMTGSNPNVRFMPVKIFSPDNAPRNTRFVVFVKEELLRYGSRPEVVYLITDDQWHCSIEYGGLELPLPEGAVLVPISEIGAVVREGAEREQFSV